MEPKREIGFQVRTLSHTIKHLVDQIAFAEQEVEITGMQGWIMGYLYENRDKDVFQRDIQTHFSVRRSTVTGMLQLMERNGLIVRSPVEWDARLKKLELTSKAMRMHESVVNGFRKAEETLSATLTPEERETFLNLCEKIKNGIEASASCRKS